MRANSLDLKKVSIHDSFWSKHVDLVRNAIIPYQSEAMNDRIPDAESSHCLENFKIAAGRAKGDFYGAVFQDTDVAKWLEAVGFSLACYPDEVLEKTADEVIDLFYNQRAGQTLDRSLRGTRIIYSRTSDGSSSCLL